ncbi:MAG: DNA polymerase III subunit gamma/tau [Rhizobiaceae bacterium]|nr:DNA polymerase III subunit gamma/tau [Rhizobiaceae bacterium]
MTDAAQPYRVLARKYRPHSFEDMIGQEPMVQTLSNAFKTGRIAQAYMMTGVRGVGKTTTARILARALNYKTEAIDQPTIDLSEEGEHCRAIIEGRHMDIIEMDAASHTGIDDIRDLIESAQYRPATARYKVYIIDEVHMLSKSAFNGLLKTLEEPPEHLKFIFATTEIRKVPVTVLSRCQRFDLRRIDAGELAEYLGKICEKEGVTIEPDALALVSRAAEGSARDALSMLDQAIAHGSTQEGGITAESMRTMLGLSDRARIVDLFEHVMKGEVAASLAEIKAQYDIGAEPQVVLNDLADFIHLVTRLKYVPDAENDRGLSEIERTKGKEFADQLSVRVLGRAWQMLTKGLTEVSASERPLAAAEMVLIRMTHASSLPTPDELVKDMQGKASARAAPLASPAASPSVSPNGGEASAHSSAPVQHAETPPQPTMSSEVSSGGQVLAMAQPQPDPVAGNNSTNSEFRVLNTFDELIFLVEDKRDLSLKTQIKRHVRLVSFVDGRMEVNLVENAPRDFLPTLGKRLEEWTGKRWMLSISQEEGAPTLSEVERAESAQRMDDAKSDPTVEAIMKQFPGSRIVNIRVRQEETEETLEPAPDDDEDQDGLDEFFE